MKNNFRENGCMQGWSAPEKNDRMREVMVDCVDLQ